jgi:hypothetical protein
MILSLALQGVARIHAIGPVSAQFSSETFQFKHHLDLGKCGCDDEELEV